jgi:hypothetical protein
MSELTKAEVRRIARNEAQRAYREQLGELLADVEAITAALEDLDGEDLHERLAAGPSAIGSASEDVAEHTTADERAFEVLSGADVVELNRSGLSPREFVRERFDVDPAGVSSRAELRSAVEQNARAEASADD